MSRVILGAVLTGAIVLIRARYRHGPPLASQPGHWLLLVFAVELVFWLPLGLLAMLWEWDMLAGFYLMQAIVYIFPVRHSKQVRWKVLFGTLVFLSVMDFLGRVVVLADLYGIWSLGILLRYIALLGRIFLMACTIAASVGDWKIRQARDWLHWTGVSTCLARQCISWMWMIWARLIQ
ncbi:MAG: hypothetical protein MI725_14485 [Pirellulales bacterium]|nr:hypothetical protein [Pirellulales bacterium]